MIVETGDRIGKTARLSAAVNGIIRDGNGVLMTRRTDNGKWCLPGGRIEPGETIEEAVIREVLEETGLETAVCNIQGVYSNPDIVYAYPDGNRWQAIEIDIRLVVTGGELRLSDETTEFLYIDLEDLAGDDLSDFMESDIPRLTDILNNFEYIK